MIEETNLVVSLEHSKLKEIPNFPENTEEAILFRNLITEINFKKKYENLRLLDLSDNKIKKIENLKMAPNVQVIDLSFNLIKEIDLISLENLQELYLINNYLKRIPKITSPLKKLDLAGNEIEVIENLENLVTLQELYLANNKISKLVGIENLRNLSIIGLQNNYFREIDCENLPKSLVNLHLDDNRNLQEIKNIDSLSLLKSVEVEKTKIKRNSIKCKNNVSITYS